MNYILWFDDKSSVYWHGVIMALAIAAAVLAACGFRRRQGREDGQIIYAAVIGIPVGMLLSRMVFWFFMQSYFNGFGDALLSRSVGGQSLLGAMLGAFIGLAAANALLKTHDLPAMLDAAAPAAALGICIGRLSGYFSLDDRGKIIENESFCRFPFGIFDPADGCWRLSVFVLESISAGLIFVACAVMFSFVYGKNSRFRSGDVMFTFLSLFGITQGTLESMRLDSLFMNSLGFVRVMQIASLVMIVFVLVIYSVRSIKNAGIRVMHIAAWAASAGLLALAFYMEFRIHSAVLMRNYAVMITCLAAVGYITFQLLAMSYYRPESSKGIWMPLRKSDR